MGGYEETPIKKIVKQLPKPKIEKEKLDMNKEQFKKTTAAHKVEIAKLKQDIKKHKLLMKQAAIVYKISKMTTKEK